MSLRSARPHACRPLAAALLLAALATAAHAQSALNWTADQACQAAELPPVQVATDSTWPPMEYINRRGELVGFDIDLLREVGRRAGFYPEFTTMPWDGIFAGLAAGQYEMIASSVTVLSERERVMHFSRPYLRAAQYVVVPVTDGTTESLADLTGESVGAQIGTTGSRIVASTPGVELRTYDDLGLAVEDLAQGRLAGIVADVAIVQSFVLGAERYRNELRVAGQPYAVEEYAFAVRLDRRELRDRIDLALAEMERDGTLRRLRRFWFPDIDF